MRLPAIFITGLLIISACSTVAGQHLFKCGASFQDKPCDSDIQKKYSSATGSFTREQVNANTDIQCADIGARAVTVIQAYANKETLENLYAKVDSLPMGRQEKAREKELITSVFRKKGSPSEIRGAIEVECMEKNQAAKKVASSYIAEDTYSARNSAAARSAAAVARAAAISSRSSR